MDIKKNVQLKVIETIILHYQCNQLLETFTSTIIVFIAART